METVVLIANRITNVIGCVLLLKICLEYRKTKKQPSIFEAMLTILLLQ